MSDTCNSLSLNYWRETEFRMQDEKANSVDPANAKITARRKDLDGGGRAEVLKLENGRAALGPGRWEMSVAPPPGYYAVERGWSEFYLRGFDTITIKLSSRPASIHGLVNGPGHEPAPGASEHETVVETTVHEPLIDTATFEQAQALRRTRASHAQRAPRRTRARTRCAGCSTRDL